MATDIYIHQMPAQSAFSQSSTSSPVFPSNAALKDEPFFKRLFGRRKSSSHGIISRKASRTSLRSRPSTSMTSTAPADHNGLVMMPSPHTHPLLSKPFARDELRPRISPAVTSLAGQGSESVSRARELAERQTEGGGRRRDGLEAEPDIYTRGLRERERLAMDAAFDGRYVSEWGFFVKCYAEGRYNTSNLPEPPPRRRDFDHLAAPAPLNESSRLQAVESCNLNFTKAVREKFQRLTLLAKKVFQTRMVAISLIDEHDEIMKTEHAVGRTYIERSESIGAHALLTNEPLVVLDTLRDWRLRGNPLVRSSPYIRFYAGAPIITPEGYAIGVFAVFDTQPRASFPVASRRKLIDFARLAMTEFELVTEEHQLALARKQQPPDLTRASSRQKRLSANLLEGIEAEVHLAARSETPPASAYSDKTIVNTSISSDRTLCPSPPPSPELPPAPRPSLESRIPSSHILHSPYGAPPFTSPPPQHLPERLFSSQSFAAESHFTLSLISRTLDFSLVYLLRVIATTVHDSPLVPRPSDPYRETRSVEVRLLASKGLPEPVPLFEPELHLRAVGLDGGLVYVNDGNAEEEQPENDVGYGMGILVPVTRDPNEQGGVVLAGFRKEKVYGEDMEAAVREVRGWVEVVKGIVERADL